MRRFSCRSASWKGLCRIGMSEAGRFFVFSPVRNCYRRRPGLWCGFRAISGAVRSISNDCHSEIAGCAFQFELSVQKPT